MKRMRIQKIEDMYKELDRIEIPNVPGSHDAKRYLETMLTGMANLIDQLNDMRIKTVPLNDKEEV